jgi:hypothetical protein
MGTLLPHFLQRLMTIWAMHNDRHRPLIAAVPHRCVVVPQYPLAKRQ